MNINSNPELQRAVDDVLSNITETRDGLQSMRTQHEELQERLQEVAVEEKELADKDEYLQKWQEKLDMQEKVLSSSSKRLRKLETNVTGKEVRLRDKELKLKDIHQEALKMVTDAKVKSKQVTDDIEGFEAKIARLEVVEGQPQQEASSSKRPFVSSFADLDVAKPSGTKRVRSVQSPRSTTLGTKNSSPKKRRMRFMGQSKERYPARQHAAAEAQYNESQQIASEGEEPSDQGSEMLQDAPAGQVQIAPEIQHIWSKLLFQGEITIEDRQKVAHLIKMSDEGKRAAAQRAEPILERCATSTEKGTELCLTSALKTLTPRSFLLDHEEDPPKPDYTIACDRCHPRYPCLRASWAGFAAKTDKDLPTRWIIERRAARQTP